MTLSVAISNWGWPQYIYMTLSLLTLLAQITLSGKPRPDYNGYVGLSNFLLAFCLLTAGGFFA